jgi:hypothetical protein
MGELLSSKPEAPRPSVVTIAKLAAVLNCTKPAIRKQLDAVPACTETIVAGQKAQAWTLAALPESLRGRLTAIAQHRGYRTIADLVKNPPKPYSPALPFNQIADQYQIEAQNWRDALASLLQRQHQIPAGELLALGLLEAKRIFGREISENTWRAHFDEAVKRDNGFEQWQRLDLYVPAAAYQVTERPTTPEPLVGGIHATLNAEIDRLGVDRLKPTLEDRAFILDASFRHLEALNETLPGPRQQKQAKRSLVLFLFSAFPKFARTDAALRRLVDRKLPLWRNGGRNHESILDGRPGNSGRAAKIICPACAAKLVSNAVARDGAIPPAHRKLMQHRGKPDGYCEACAELIHLNERKNKTYVSRSIRLQVHSDVNKLVPHRRGAKTVYQKSPWISRIWSDVAPGDFFSSDDATFNFPFRYEDGTGMIGRGECLLTVDWRTDFIIDHVVIGGHFNQEHVRLSIKNACQKVNGRPRLGFIFENSVYASLAIDGRDADSHPKWAMTQWREVEASFRKLGLSVGSRNDLDFGLADPALGLEVRHTRAGNPRSKTIEGTIRRLQEIQRPLDNFLGFNEREYNAEAAQRTLRQARQFDPEALAKIPTISQWRDIIDQTVNEQNREIQNGKKLPGISPLEAWTNGVESSAGIATRPLPGLDLETLFRLGTWQRKVRVESEGIIITIGKRKYPYWGKELEPYIHKDVIARFNFTDPSILFCRSLDSKHFFALKHMTANSTFERAEVLADLNRERSAMMRPARIEFSKLVPPITFSITRDETTDQQTQEFARFSQEQLDKHRDEKAAAAKTSKRIEKLASALGVAVPTTPASPARTTQKEEALERMKQRRVALDTATEDKQ